jgi:hypothetical protein
MPSTWHAAAPAVVVNDLGGTMHGNGSDTAVADEAVADSRRGARVCDRRAISAMPDHAEVALPDPAG